MKKTNSNKKKSRNFLLIKNIPRGTVEKMEKQKNNDIYREKQINQHTKREFRWLCPVG
jgi:hypothetical protein